MDCLAALIPPPWRNWPVRPRPCSASTRPSPHRSTGSSPRARGTPAPYLRGIVGLARFACRHLVPQAAADGEAVRIGGAAVAEFAEAAF